MEKDDTNLYITVAILIIAVVIIVYLFYQQSSVVDRPPDDGNGGVDPDPDIPPGMTLLKFNKTAKGWKEIKWDLGGYYYATSLIGNVRPGGTATYVNIRIYVHAESGWKRLTTVAGWSQSYLPFELPVNMKINRVEWRAEQGFLTARYVDEVNAQLMVEV